MSNSISSLIKSLNLEVNDLHLLANAFVHRSFLNESKEFNESNERLEYLGDAVLELATSEFLYRKYPSYQEGMLTNLRASLVRTESLGAVADKLGFPDHLMMSRGEESTGGRHNLSLLADTFEAFLGALYLDQGFQVCVSFLETQLFGNIESIIARSTYKDYKSLLQEIAQSRFKTTPRYDMVSEEGPDHDKLFRMKAVIGTTEYGIGEGKSKQSAEVAAARETLEIINAT